MKYLMLLCCCLFSVALFAQKQVDPQMIDGAYITIAHMPVFDGNLAAYIKKNKHYPEEQKKYGTEGRDGVKFIVNEDGSISNIQVIRTIGMDFDNETIRLVENMPKWKPGIENGQPVKVWMTLSVLYMPPK